MVMEAAKEISDNFGLHAMTVFEKTMKWKVRCFSAGPGKVITAAKKKKRGSIYPSNL